MGTVMSGPESFYRTATTSQGTGWKARAEVSAGRTIVLMIEEGEHGTGAGMSVSARLTPQRARELRRILAGALLRASESIDEPDAR